MGDWFSFRHRGGRFAQTETALGLVVLFAVVVLLGLVAAVAIGFRNSQNLANDLDQRAEQRGCSTMSIGWGRIRSPSRRSS
jgi:hypothetical protein